ncbi:MAG: Ribose-phosphate pyrophosphokinase [candidate division TM6 bacterium GW2011_GWF2_32_72]|nr:MAG: Ribose-phosphate pyrophosphokinase [candidate division TM6 bacterium GW2011_GWF2_32_72]
MILFNTRSAEHLAEKMNIQRGKIDFTRFADGEFRITVKEDVAGKIVWVLASTEAPAENWLELFFLLDVLKNQGAIINLLITYFGYARQDHPENNEAAAAQFLAEKLEQFNLNKILILHPHSTRLHNWLTYTEIIPYDLYIPIALESDVIIAPDKGAKTFVSTLAKECKRDYIILEKSRIDDKTVRLDDLPINIKDKKILVADDMISTGSTLIAATELLWKYRPINICAIATHGLFIDSAKQKIESSYLEDVFVTNSLPNQFGKSCKIELLNLTNFLERYLIG